MVNEAGYTISELAREAKVTPRTIRYYTTEGLLPQPGSQGRYARYTQEHLERLRQIALLKEQYLPLHIIRERLTAGNESAAEPSSADSPPTPALHLHSSSPSQHPQPLPPPTSRPPVEPPGGPAHAPLLSAERQATHPLQLGHYQFFPDHPEAPETADGDHAAQSESWQRVVLAPGVELHIREPISAERRQRLEALIAAARDQLLFQQFPLALGAVTTLTNGSLCKE